MSPLQPPEEPTTTITVVVMGVSGSGKTTVAMRLVELLGWPFAEGDDFHPVANVEKMRSGRPLSDRDRKPWLAAVADWIGEQEVAGRSAVVSCSALKRAYREALRRNHPSVWFVHVSASPAGLKARLETRSGHYMPASLLASQLETLEEPSDALIVDISHSPGAIVEQILAELRGPTHAEMAGSTDRQKGDA